MSMTISEALRVANERELFGHEKVIELPIEAWRVIRSRLEVSDEMVVRANDAYQEYALEHPLSEFICSGEATEAYMKAALVAALGE